MADSRLTAPDLTVLSSKWTVHFHELGQCDYGSLKLARDDLHGLVSGLIAGAG